MHRVAPIFIQGTAGFASGKQATQKSFREDHMVPYACIASYGVVNEVAAKSTQLSNEDIELLVEGLWKGTEGLISRSKMGHQPIMLLRIVYKDGFRIGDLAGRISLSSDIEDIKIRSISEYAIDVTKLVDAILLSGEHIERIEVKQDERLRFRDGQDENAFANIQRLAGLTVKQLTVG